MALLNGCFFLIFLFVVLAASRLTMCLDCLTQYCARLSLPVPLAASSTLTAHSSCGPNKGSTPCCHELAGILNRTFPAGSTSRMSSPEMGYWV